MAIKMANKRITELTEKAALEVNDYLAIDNTAGTKRVNAARIVNPLGNISGSSDAYSTTKAYSVGDLVIYNEKLYKCNTACAAGSWATNSGYFDETTLATEVDSLNSSLSDKLIVGEPSEIANLATFIASRDCIGFVTFATVNAGYYNLYLKLGNRTDGGSFSGNTGAGYQQTFYFVIKAGEGISVLSASNVGTAKYYVI